MKLIFLHRIIVYIFCVVEKLFYDISTVHVYCKKKFEAHTNEIDAKIKISPKF